MSPRDNRMRVAVQLCQANASLPIDDALRQSGFDSFAAPQAQITATLNGSNVDAIAAHRIRHSMMKKTRVELIRRLRNVGCTNPGVTEMRSHRGRPKGSKDVVPRRRKVRICWRCQQAECPNAMNPGPNTCTGQPSPAVSDLLQGSAEESTTVNTPLLQGNTNLTRVNGVQRIESAPQDDLEATADAAVHGMLQESIDWTVNSILHGSKEWAVHDAEPDDFVNDD